MKFLIVDGHNLLFKSFFGLPKRQAINGNYVHAIFGFIGILIKIIKLIQPTHILVVFDPEEIPSRINLNNNYKKNRLNFNGVADKDNPFSQLIHIKNCLDALGIGYIEQSGHEADDMIASFAIKLDGLAIIVSSDADFIQLVNEKVAVFRYNGKNSIYFDENAVMEKYGISPRLFLNYKSLVGDPADNIKGVKGIGPKTALKVLRGERILTDKEIEIFRNNMEIMRLDDSIELPKKINDLKMNNNLSEIKIGEFLRKMNII